MNALITILYLCFNVIALIAYAPQMIKVYLNKNCRSGISIITWGLWTIGGICEFLYAFFVVKNNLWAGVSLGHFFACLWVFSFGLNYRLNLKNSNLSELKNQNKFNLSKNNVFEKNL